MAVAKKTTTRTRKTTASTTSKKTSTATPTRKTAVTKPVRKTTSTAKKEPVKSGTTRSKVANSANKVVKESTTSVAKKTPVRRKSVAKDASVVAPKGTSKTTTKTAPTKIKVNQRTKFEERLKYNYVLRANGHVVCEKDGVNYLSWSSGPFEAEKYLPINDEDIKLVVQSRTEARKVRKKLLGVDDKPKWG